MEVHEVGWSPERAAGALYDALAAGDRDVLGRILHPDFVGETTPGLPLDLGGRYDGPGEMRRAFWGRLGRSFDVSARPDEMVRLEDGRLMVRGSYLGTARATGAKVDAVFVHLLRFEGERIVGLVQVTDSQRWAVALVADPPTTPQGLETDRELTSVDLTLDGQLARLRLARPDAANSIDPTMVADLALAVERCAHLTGARALLITGDGDRFCAGGDLRYFAGLAEGQLGETLGWMIPRYHRALLELGDLPLPVVCAVQGSVAGGGLGLLFAADIVVAARGTRFAMGYPALGLVSDGGGTWWLPRLVGPARAASMFLDNRVLDADEALACGLVSEVVDPGDLPARAEDIATRLAAGPTAALASMRRLLRQSWTTPLGAQLDAEAAAMAEVGATADATEGVTAFAEKRRPTFHGR